MAEVVEFAYEAPEISEEGDVVTWHWVIVNNGSEPVTKVVLTHRVTPTVVFDRLTGPSEVVGEVVKSRWETLGAGEKSEGTITAALPEDLTGTVQINGRVVWQNATAN
ncbi:MULTISPECIES: hypothetical protein [unclassified Streptomyces]|uniref:hypothetical protein n=1 Tax=unclassified Streptomyces TaxID=2593676 RepID=UPI000DC7A8EC|nr:MULTISPECIES: hypothetical protein [unclassified Streptomyces]AWZ05690.1 hypothetical protein DRB89_14665 [Streptomyces sp. ICC4]AWZ11939.1 hypothetical protein DRB96_05990 [Streptomyces sp. ICC1]